MNKSRMVTNLDDVEGQKIKTRNHPRDYYYYYYICLCGLGIRIQPTFALVRVVRGD